MTYPVLDVEAILKGSWQCPYDLHPEHYKTDTDRPCVVHAHYWHFKAARAVIHYLSLLENIREALNHISHESRIDIVLSLAETIENIFDEKELNRDMTDRTSIAIYIEGAKRFPYDLMNFPSSEETDSEIYIPAVEIPNCDLAEFISARAIIENLQQLRLQIVDHTDSEAINVALESVGKEERGLLIERLATLIKASHDTKENDCK